MNRNNNNKMAKDAPRSTGSIAMGDGAPSTGNSAVTNLSNISRTSMNSTASDNITRKDAGQKQQRQHHQNKFWPPKRSSVVFFLKMWVIKSVIFLLVSHAVLARRAHTPGEATTVLGVLREYAASRGVAIGGIGNESGQRTRLRKAPPTIAAATNATNSNPAASDASAALLGVVEHTPNASLSALEGAVPTPNTTGLLASGNTTTTTLLVGDGNPPPIRSS